MSDSLLSLVLVNMPNFIGLLVCIYMQTRIIDKQDRLINLLIEKIDREG